MRFTMNGRAAAMLTFGLAAAGVARAALDVGSPSSGWTGILYPNAVVPDPSNDQQTGSTEGDLVGNAAHAAFYTEFDQAGTPSLVDGTLAFRARVGADKAPPGFATAVFVGIDANRDGALDLFLGVNNSGSANHVGIWAPGTGANTSPSTTTIVTPPLTSYAETASNYDWRPVDATSDPTATSYDIDGGGETDQFVTFAVPFYDVVTNLAARGIAIDETTRMTYVMATATQANSLNQDLSGVSGSVNSSLTWAQLGVVSVPIDATGDMSPMAVVLYSFSARSENGRVIVRWQTASEIGTTGFDLYRKVGADWVKVHDARIVATGAPQGGMGASYALADAGAAAGGTYEYQLVEIEEDGTPRAYGPFERTASAFEITHPFRATPEGIEVRWLSREGERYRVLRSTNLLDTVMHAVGEAIEPTPPENVFVDTHDAPVRVYRVELE